LFAREREREREREKEIPTDKLVIFDSLEPFVGILPIQMPVDRLVDA